MFLITIILLALILYLIIISKCTRNKKIDEIPGPPGLPLLGSAFDFFLTTVQVFYKFLHLVAIYKNIFKIKMGPKVFVLITRPEDVETLISGSTNNSKGYLYNFVRPWFQDGLLVSDGPKWHQRRKILTPAFHFNILQNFKGILLENSLKLVENLEYEVGKSKTNITSYIVPFTLNSICETAMGAKLDENSDGKMYKDAIATIGETLTYRAERFWLYPDFIFSLTETGRKQKDLLNYITSFRNEVVDKRRSSDEHVKVLQDIINNTNNDNFKKKGRLAMLDLLLQAESDGLINKQGIDEEVDTFMFEGHDTTATALKFCFMLLANHTDIQEKIVEEHKLIFGDTNREPTMNDLSQMKYLECCIKESMRLYPPVYFISRTLNVDTKFVDCEVPAGVDCTILIYQLHRNSCFKDPLTYRPERFLDEASTWHPYAYIPFSAGPRNCIGQKFAMMEMKLVVSSVLRKYKLLPVTRPKDLALAVDLILRSEHPIYVKLENRKQ